MCVHCERGLPEVAGLCGFWDGSCQHRVCGAGMLIKVFTLTLGWATIHKKCGPVPGQNSFDEIEGCSMLMGNLIKLVNKYVSDH